MNTPETQAQEKLHDYLPHRSTMLLVDRLIDVGETFSETEIEITPTSSFYTAGFGVPAWIGIEYMGQTAATIAGYQLEAGTIEPHIGLLLGTRSYACAQEWFADGALLRIRCTELSVMEGTVATFRCEIRQQNDAVEAGFVIAAANLTVYRTPQLPSGAAG